MSLAVLQFNTKEQKRSTGARGQPCKACLRVPRPFDALVHEISVNGGMKLADQLGGPHQDMAGPGTDFVFAAADLTT